MLNSFCEECNKEERKREIKRCQEMSPVDYFFAVGLIDDEEQIFFTLYGLEASQEEKERCMRLNGHLFGREPEDWESIKGYDKQSGAQQL